MPVAALEFLLGGGALRRWSRARPRYRCTRGRACTQQRALNHIRGAQFVRADVLVWRPAIRYDLIAANLFSELLIAALPIFRRTLRARGRMIVSGILREQASGVVRALGVPASTSRKNAGAANGSRSSWRVENLVNAR